MFPSPVALPNPIRCTILKFQIYLKDRRVASEINGARIATHVHAHPGVGHIPAHLEGSIHNICYHCDRQLQVVHKACECAVCQCKPGPQK